MATQRDVDEPIRPTGTIGAVSRLGIGVLAMVLLVVVGCASDDDGDTAGDTATTATMATPPGPPTTVDDPDGAADGTDGTADSTDGAADEAGATEIVEAFMEARVAGGGADAYLTEGAVGAFGVSLYEVDAFAVASVEAADANSFEVTVVVTGPDGTERTELLFVGPGQPVEGSGTVVVRGVAPGT